MTRHDSALAYAACVVPIPARQKVAAIPGWPEFRAAISA